MHRILLAAFLIALAGPAAAQGIPTLTLGTSSSVSLVPPGKITADGKRISLVFVVADEKGTLADGVKWKGSSATLGRFDGECSQVARGTYSCPYVTPEEAGIGTADLKVKAKLATGSTLEASFPIVLTHEIKAKIAFASQPEKLILTQDPSSQLLFTITSPSGRPVDGLKLQATSNVGEVQAMAPLGGGRYSAIFVPPATQFPQVATVTVWDATEPERVFSFFRIPLIGKVAYPVDARQAGVTLVFKVGDQTFPPAVTDATGVARVPILVPPGVSEAQVEMITPTGSRNTQRIDLQVPPFNRLSLGGLPSFVPADGKSEARVRIFVVDKVGRPADGVPVMVTASLGTISPAQFLGNGLYESVWRAPLLETASKATISAAIQGEEAVSQDAAEIALEPGLPESISVTVDPSVITPSVNKVTLTATVLSEEGKPVGGHGVEFRTADGPVKNPKSVSPGVLSAELPVTWNVKTPMQAILATRGNRQPVHAIVALPLTDLVLTNQKVPVTVIAVDRFGNPVANVPINAAVISGGGSVTPSVQTDKAGLGPVLYSAGPLVGLAVLRFTAGDVVGEASIWQSAEAVDGFSFPVGGGQDLGRLMSQWKKLRTQMVLGGQAPEVAAVTPTQPSSPWGGAPTEVTTPVEKDTASVVRGNGATRIEVAAVPTSVPVQGGTVNVLVRIVDKGGMLVPGEKVILLADAGSITNKMDNGDGTFSALLSVPPNVGKASIQVTATRPQGDLVSFAQVAVGGVAATAATNQPKEKPVVVKQPKEPRPTSAVVDGDARLKHRTAQITIGYAPGAYSYHGAPCADPADAACAPPTDAVLDSYDFLKTDIAAGTWGSVHIQGEVFPGQEYVGAALSFNHMSYQTDFPTSSSDGDAYCSTHFCDTMNTFWVGAQGRLPLLKKVGPLDILGRFGYQFEDVVVFRQVADAAGGKGPRFQTLNLHGLRGGLGVRFTVVPQVQPHVNYDLTGALAASLTDGDEVTNFSFNGITDHHLDLGASFFPWKGLMLDFTYGLMTRNVGLSWTNELGLLQRGEAAEQSHQFRLSAGWAF